MRTGIRSTLTSHAILLLSLVTAAPIAAQEASVTETRQEMRTYPFGDPDPVPRMSNIYPYFRFDGYSIAGEQHPWKIVKIENPYISVLIAPEIGGKILGAIEKSTGNEFIYFNKVVKFRQIAMRGPWTSGGIEFNFGAIGHTPTTSTPVDYLVRKNRDGSVSCFVGALDLPSRTEWRVEIRVPGNGASFETRSFWYNPTDMNTSLYHWMNAAADGDDDLRLDYPGTKYIDHGGNAFPWPTDARGRRLNCYRNNVFGSNKSYHVLGSYTDFFGLYWESRRFGLGHWSRYTEKPGKKIWMWVLSPEGQIWRDLLTDADLGNKQYVEIQTGLLFNQAARASSLTPFKHLSFAPQSSVRFSELWFPIKEIGGVRAANEYGGLYADRRGDKLVFGFCPIRSIDQTLRITVDEKTAYQEHLSLKPMQAHVDSISLEGKGEFELIVGDRLLTYREGDWDRMKLGRPVDPAADFDWNSSAGLYLDGLERARQRDYEGAINRYRESLERDPHLTPALVGAAEVYHRRGEDSVALLFARRALAVDTYDSDANFIYGVINRSLGKVFDARDGFGVASLQMKYRSAALLQLGELDCLEGNYDEALRHARESLNFNAANVRAHQLLALASRRGGGDTLAREALKRLLELDPLSHFAAFENYLIDPSETALGLFTAQIQNELPHESYLELASYYFNLKCWKEAAQVLAVAPDHAIVRYWRAFVHAKMGNAPQALAELSGALDASPFLVFPFRLETASVLEWALAKKSHWKTRYYLGLIRWSQNRADDAGVLFRQCGDEPDFFPFYLARGTFAEMNGGSDPERDYQRALQLDPGRWRCYHLLEGFYEKTHQYAKCLHVTTEAAHRFPDNYVVQVDHAKSLLFTEQYEACLGLLDTLTILPFEGARYGREMYRQANVMSAIEALGQKNFAGALQFLGNAQKWPEHLGVGEPYDVDRRLEHFLESYCLTKLGRRKDALQKSDDVIGVTRSGQWKNNSNCLLAALMLRSRGFKEEATMLLDRWKEQAPSNAVAGWCKAVFDGTPTADVEALAMTGIGKKEQPWNPAPEDPHFVLVKKFVESGLDLSFDWRE